MFEAYPGDYGEQEPKMDRARDNDEVLDEFDSLLE